jgi:putative membrane protein
MRRHLLTTLLAFSLATPALAGSDVEFLKQAASGGMLEVQLGEHAAMNAASEEVRSFGQQMVRDHGKANAEIAALAKKEGIELPSELSSEHAEIAAELMRETGTDFDVKYMKAMVEDHREDIAAFRAEAADAKTDVDRWAAKMVPTLEHHLEMAKGVQRGVAQVDRALQMVRGERPARERDPFGRMGPGSLSPSMRDRSPVPRVGR